MLTRHLAIKEDVLDEIELGSWLLAEWLKDCGEPFSVTTERNKMTAINCALLSNKETGPLRKSLRRRRQRMSLSEAQNWSEQTIEDGTNQPYRHLARRMPEYFENNLNEKFGSSTKLGAAWLPVGIGVTSCTRFRQHNRLRRSLKNEIKIRPSIKLDHRTNDPDIDGQIPRFRR
ncbi:hypothetical protein HHJ49_00060 [Escherichia coli]|nr:hypothetical protein HHJ49_00060 [Escherichia coli]